MKALLHFLTITRHHNLVMGYCFRAGLYRQGLLHDLSKYSPAEFLVGAKYYQGNRSPNNAEREDIGMKGSNYTNTMMVQLGVRLYFAAGSDKNIKLTTKDNLEMFKAYLKQDDDQWLK